MVATTGIDLKDSELIKYSPELFQTLVFLRLDRIEKKIDRLLEIREKPNE